MKSKAIDEKKKQEQDADDDLSVYVLSLQHEQSSTDFFSVPNYYRSLV